MYEGDRVGIRGRQNDIYSSDDSENCGSVVDPPSNVNILYFTEYFERDNPLIIF